MPDAPLIKDLIDNPSVRQIVTAVVDVEPRLDVDEIMGRIFDEEWEARALKQRIRHAAEMIRSSLPDPYPEALAVMRSAAKNLDEGRMAAWVFCDFVEVFGVDYPDVSIPALEQFTKLISAEFAVRPFIDRYPERMADQMLSWAKSKNADVRRLATEGFRPRLPWGMGLPALKKDPSPVLPVLEQLYQDPSEVVRRSVANNLNDISKDNPEVTVAVLRGWSDGTENTQALIKHALRTLLKKGDPGALELLGFSPTPDVVVASLHVEPKEPQVGGSVHIDFCVESTSKNTQRLMVDFAVTYQNVSGTGSRKVFKGVVADLEGGGSLPLRRKVTLRQQTTRRILPGLHTAEIQVNGAVLASVEFDVTR